MIKRFPYADVTEVIITVDEGNRIEYMDTICEDVNPAETMLPANVTITNNHRTLTVSFTYNATGVILYDVI